MESNFSAWEERAIKDLEAVFWNWDECLEFREMREKLLLTSKQYQQLAEQMITEDSVDISRLLLPDILAQKFKSMHAPIVRDNVPTRKRTLSPIRWDEKLNKPIIEISVATNYSAIDSGHFGWIFEYLTFGTTQSVLKLLRYEHVKKPLDIYSFVMEIIIGILIQARGLLCTPRIIYVIKTDKTDVGLGMEKLSAPLSDFFFKGAGATDVRLGLLILIEVVQKLFWLQRVFRFRHRDFRMKNVMLKSDFKITNEVLLGNNDDDDDDDTKGGSITPQPGNVRIIDLGKSSIYFQGKCFTSYAGWKYGGVRKDFDLGFFLCDMLLQFEKHSNAKVQLELYEPIVRPLLLGIRYDDLVNQSNIYSILMSRVHNRVPSTRYLTRPRYVNKQLTLIFNQLTKD
jgi:hypothetical protein